MYTTKYGDQCECPYCGEIQESVDLEDVDDEEIECDRCNGKFSYSLEVTYDFTCEPIDGEGPDSDEFPAPKFIDPNQINLFDGVTACSRT